MVSKSVITESAVQNKIEPVELDLRTKSKAFIIEFESTLNCIILAQRQN